MASRDHTPAPTTALRTATRRTRAAAALTTVGVTAALLATSPTGPTAIELTASKPAHTSQASVTTGGFFGGHGGSNANRPTERRLLSKDGRFVTFESNAALAGTKALGWQVYQRDRKLGTTVLVSVGRNGQRPNGNSVVPSSSEDGRYVAFMSYATNLVAGDTNGKTDVFVRDLKTNTTTRVSTTSAGGQVVVPGVGTFASGEPSISPDGGFVAFLSLAEGLTPDSSPTTEAYLRDVGAGTTELVSRSHLGLPVDALAGSTVSVSRGGEVVVFESGNANVVAGDTNSDRDIFVRNRVAGTTTMVSVGEDGSKAPVLSADGKFVAYAARNTGFAGDPGSRTNIFVHNIATGGKVLASRDSAGAWANADSSNPAISNDGRYVTYTSSATNLVAGDTNGEADVFRQDTVTGTTVRVSVRSNGAQNSQNAGWSAISGDGQQVLFLSHGANLTSVPTHTWGNAFVRSLNGAWPALHASVGKLPKRMKPSKSVKVKTKGIAAKQKLVIVWKAPGKKKITRTVAVKGNKLVLKAPKRAKYKVTITYAGHKLRQGKVRVG